MRTIDTSLERYSVEIATARKQFRETFRYIQEACPHAKVAVYRPKAKLLERLINSTNIRGVAKPFSHVVFRICPTCGKEEQVVYEGLLPGKLKEDLEKRIFPSSIFRDFTEIDESEFFRIRHVFAYLSSDDD